MARYNSLFVVLLRLLLIGLWNSNVSIALAAKTTIFTSLIPESKIHHGGDSLLDSERQKLDDSRVLVGDDDDVSPTVDGGQDGGEEAFSKTR